MPRHVLCVYARDTKARARVCVRVLSVAWRYLMHGRRCANIIVINYLISDLYGMYDFVWMCIRGDNVKKMKCGVFFFLSVCVCVCVADSYIMRVRALSVKPLLRKLRCVCVWLHFRCVTSICSSLCVCVCVCKCLLVATWDTWRALCLFGWV